MICPECGNNETRIIANEEICISCGLVLDETISSPSIENTKKQYAQQPDVATAGSRRQDGKIVKYEWLFTTREKNIRQSDELLEMVASRHNLTDNVVKETRSLLQQAIKTNFSIGRETSSVVYACVYAACTITKTPKISRELVLNSGVTKTVLLRTYKHLKRHLNIQAENLKPSDLVERFGNKLKLDQPAIQKALDLTEQVQDLMQGKRPETIAAAALYLAGKPKVTQRQIANTVGIIEVTIRKRTKEIINQISDTTSSES
jgi:transcription initiation factor TFIIIB Brf1 subunit/transcription initiation factor TFIIB